MEEDLNWDKFCTVGRGVLIVVRPLLELQVDFQRPLTIYPWVLGPHFSKRLPNGAERVLHYVGANIFTIGADVATAVIGGKCGKDWYGVLV